MGWMRDLFRKRRCRHAPPPAPDPDRIAEAKRQLRTAEAQLAEIREHGYEVATREQRAQRIASVDRFGETIWEALGERRVT